jgi:hypothetical protein
MILASADHRSVFDIAVYHRAVPHGSMVIHAAIPEFGVGIERVPKWRTEDHWQICHHVGRCHMLRLVVRGHWDTSVSRSPA